MKKTLGLIGFPLNHSFSKTYFNAKFEKEQLNDYEYVNFPIENIEELPSIIENHPHLTGFNVTIPHKISILPFLTGLEENAALIGSVNTVKIMRNDSIELIGYNTDVSGFMMALKPQLRPDHNRALILGNGGSSKAVQFVLRKLGIEFLIVSRSPRNANEISYENLNENHIRFHPLIVNTTPVGMWPEVEKYPSIDYSQITESHLLFDLIYNPEMTVFLRKGKEKGAMISNGLSMLHQQAEAAWKIWNQK